MYAAGDMTSSVLARMSSAASETCQRCFKANSVGQSAVAEVRRECPTPASGTLQQSGELRFYFLHSPHRGAVHHEMPEFVGRVETRPPSVPLVVAQDHDGTVSERERERIDVSGLQGEPNYQQPVLLKEGKTSSMGPAGTFQSSRTDGLRLSPRPNQGRSVSTGRCGRSRGASLPAADGSTARS